MSKNIYLILNETQDELSALRALVVAYFAADHEYRRLYEGARGETLTMRRAKERRQATEAALREAVKEQK